MDEVIRELGLEDAQHTKIGTPFIKGVSGGQKRRVSIGEGQRRGGGGSEGRGWGAGGTIVLVVVLTGTNEYGSCSIPVPDWAPGREGAGGGATRALRGIALQLAMWVSVPMEWSATIDGAYPCP